MSWVDKAPPQRKHNQPKIVINLHVFRAQGLRTVVVQKPSCSSGSHVPDILFTNEALSTDLY